MASPTLLVAGAELRRRLRNRSAIITAFVGPLAMAIVFGVLIGGASGADFEIGIVDADGSDITRGLVDSLVGGPGDDTGAARVRFAIVADAAAARDDVDDADLGAAIVIPAGFTDAVTSGGPASLVVLRSPDRLVSGQVAESVAAAIAAGFDRAATALAAVATRTGTAPDAATVVAAAALGPPMALGDTDPGGSELDASAFYGASMSILFLFFTTGFAARSLLAERRDGTLDRILATPTSPGSVIAGKAIAVGLLGLSGFVTVWAATSLLFGAPWGSPLGVVAVMAFTVAAITGVATFTAGLARTERQADTTTSAVTFVLALLGGNFVGPGAAPPLLRTLSLATPNGWALKAFTDLSADAASPATVVPTLGVLAGIAVAFGSIGLASIHRLVSR